MKAQAWHAVSNLLLCAAALALDVAGQLSLHGHHMVLAALSAMGATGAIAAWRAANGPAQKAEQAIAPMVAQAIQAELALARAAFEKYLDNAMKDGKPPVPEAAPTPPSPTMM